VHMRGVQEWASTGRRQGRGSLMCLGIVALCDEERLILLADALTLRYRSHELEQTGSAMPSKAGLSGPMLLKIVVRCDPELWLPFRTITHDRVGADTCRRRISGSHIFDASNLPT